MRDPVNRLGEASSTPRRLYDDTKQEPTAAQLKRASDWYASWLARRYPGTVWEDVPNERETERC
jgi:hypothetical protein